MGRDSVISFFNFLRNLLIGSAVILISCSYSLTPGWKDVSNKSEYSKYFTYWYQLPGDCYVFEDFHDYELDHNGKVILFAGLPKTNLTGNLPVSIEWYKNNSRDWKTFSVDRFTGEPSRAVHRYNILGILEAGTQYRVLKVLDWSFFLAMYHNPDSRRLLIEIESGPFTGRLAIIYVLVNGDGFVM